jgi:SAM-dependent methyltransferase
MNDLEWSQFWREQDRFTSIDDGPLAKSYYQNDREKRLTGLFDEMVETMAPSGRVLDLGCGNGAGAAALLAAADVKERTLEIDMIDRVPVYPPPILANRVRISRGDAERLDFPDSTFDLVLSCFCAEFCDLPQVLREIHRVLRRGARLAMFVYTKESPIVSIQSEYVNIYRKGLKQLLDELLSGRIPSGELIHEIRVLLQREDPRPRFRAHMESIVDHIAAMFVEYGSAEFDVDKMVLPNIEGQPAFSARTLQRRLTLWDAINVVAFDVHDGFELHRRLDRMGFDDAYIIPAEFQYARIAYFQNGEKL